MFTSTAWSFSGTPKKSSFGNETLTPGPGRYNQNSNFKKSLRTTSSFSFGKEMKLADSIKNIPGPGYYQKSDYSLFGSQTPKYTISKAKLSSEIIIPDFSKKSFTIVNKVPQTPAPGYYSINNEKIIKLKNRPPSYKFSKNSREIDYNNKTPGPGFYQAKVIKNKSPEWSISKTARSDVWSSQNIFSTRSFTPGPGEYKYKTLIGEGPKVNFYLHLR